MANLFYDLQKIISDPNSSRDLWCLPETSTFFLYRFFISFIHMNSQLKPLLVLKESILDDSRLLPLSRPPPI